MITASDAMPVPPDGGNGLAPSATGQGGFGPNAVGDGGLGQNPLNIPPSMSPPPPGGGPPGSVFVPVFVPPMLPPASPPSKDSADHQNRAVSPLSHHASLPPPPPGFGPPQRQPQGGPPFHEPQPNVTTGPPGNLQQTLGSSTPSELGGSQPISSNATPGHGGITPMGSEGGLSQPPGGGGVMPNHTGSTFAPSSGDIGSFPSSHGDVGPPGSYAGAPCPPGPPGGGPPPTGGAPFGPIHPPVYVPSSSFGIPGQDGQRNKHHHHRWLPPYATCDDRDCVLHSSSHVCHQGCQCCCQDPNCPLNR